MVLQILKGGLRPLAGKIDWKAEAETAPARLYVFGSSSSEVFDYIFGATPRYRSYWAGGWSARGLRKEANRGYVLKCLENARPQDIIFLHFGVVDAVFNAGYRVDRGDFLDPEGFCREAAEGIKMLVADLRGAGFSNIYTVAVGAPCKVPARYFRKRFQLHGLPARYQAQLLNRINQLISDVCDRRDLTPVLADEHGVLKPEFHRAKRNHHADYVKIQELVWKGIRDIPGLPPRRQDWRSELYKSGVRGGVGKRIAAGNFNPVNLKRFEEPQVLSRKILPAAEEEQGEV
ncbi:hypothetical protein [Leisingera sp. XS_AS12]|uniref:hypothetical protein n=1 Tax=Leisingera sp. XS_AS12 TaxID=3241294 RepID=UPI003511D407